MIVKVYDTLEEVDQSLWDSICEPDRIICRYNYLLAIEKSKINDCRYRYIMIFHEDKLIAHSCFYSMSFDLDIFNRGASEKIIRFIRNNFNQEFMRIKVIECGTPTALGNTITIVQGYDYLEILKEICLAMEKFGREKKIHILIFRDFYEKDLESYDKLKKIGFKRIKVLSSAEVTNNWKNFEAFLSDMRSRYRYRVKKFLKSLDRADITIEVCDDFSGLANKLTGLWFQIYHKASEYKREVLTPEYFINMDKYLGDKSKVILFKKRGEIIGFNFIVLDDDTLRPLFIGIDYKYNKQNNLYFNILCQSIKFGIDCNKKFIEMGITTIEPKKELGAHVIPAFCYMKHNKKIRNFFMTNLFALFSPPIYSDRRNVFNRRYYERIYKPFWLKLYHKHEMYLVTAEDISLKGIRISNIKGSLRKNTKVVLEFSFPGEQNSFFVKSRIVWRKMKEEEVQCGLKFIDKSFLVKEKIQAFVDFFKQKSLNENT